MTCFKGLFTSRVVRSVGIFLGGLAWLTNEELDEELETMVAVVLSPAMSVLLPTADPPYMDPLGSVMSKLTFKVDVLGIAARDILDKWAFGTRRKKSVWPHSPVRARSSRSSQS